MSFSIGNYLSKIKPGNSLSTSITSQEVVVAPDFSKPKESKDFTQLIRNNETKDRHIQSSIDDVKPLRSRTRNISLAKPSEEEVKACTERTRKVLDDILQSRLGNNTISSKSTSEYVRYTSSNIMADTPTSSRLIKIVDVQQDPMAPPKFKQKKQLERPPSPPAPILHAPSTHKPTKEEQAQWYIPPAISNWKNPNGYTIALDKRLAVDGRDPNSNESEINENFINLATALEDADKKAREEIKLRNSMKKKLAEKENREKEEKLRELAQRARMERIENSKSQYFDEENDDSKKRALIREERRKKAIKELRQSKMGTETRLKAQAKTLLNRDISQRTQLGLAKATQSAEIQFDSRLFQNSTQVINSEDQVYDNPLFVQQGINSIYRVSQNEDADDHLKSISDEKRFDEINSGPVEFEKDKSTNSHVLEDSEYGLRTKKQKTSN